MPIVVLHQQYVIDTENNSNIKRINDSLQKWVFNKPALLAKLIKEEYETLDNQEKKYFIKELLGMPDETVRFTIRAEPNSTLSVEIETEEV